MTALARDRWYSFECANHSGHRTTGVPSSTGVVFDVRLGPEVVELRVARCPVCGSRCNVKTSWPADKHGFGGLGDKTVQEELFALREIADRLEGKSTAGGAE